MIINIFNILLSTAFLLSTTFLYSQDSTFYPLSKEVKWTYKGNIKWQEVDNPAVFDSTITWEVKITDVVKGDDFIAAEMVGDLDDLTFYERGKKPSEYIIIYTGGYYYSIYDIEGNIKKHMKTFRNSLTMSKGIIELVEPFLKDSMKAGDIITNGKHFDPGYEDSHNYAWYVRSVTTAIIKDVAGVSPDEEKEIYELIFKTGPDANLIDFAPGIGIINYVYEHHGSTSSCDMKLVKFEK